MMPVEQKSLIYTRVLHMTQLETLLGPMLAIADDHALHRLEFIDRRDLTHEITFFGHMTQSHLLAGRLPIIDQLEQELNHYFAGTLRKFSIPHMLTGTEFQQNVWQELQKIPYATTQSYSDIAHALNRPTSFRAVAQANGANMLAIVIPCHRVINANGDLGGYNGGIARKEWLLNHERKHS